MIRRSWLHRFTAVVLALTFALIPAVALAGDPIDVGQGATDRASSTLLWLASSDRTYTCICGSGAADGTGSIDTVEYWLTTNVSSFDMEMHVGTFEDNGSNSLTCRDYENIGNPGDSGAKRTATGLDIDVESGDYIGAAGHATSSYDYNLGLEYQYNSSDGAWRVTDYGIGTTKTYTWYSDDAASLRGTGETSGSTPDISNTPSTENLGIVGASSTVYAKGSSPSNPVGDSDCTFTVTNNSGAAVDIDIKGANWTGGVGWTLTSNSPGSNETRITAYYSGQNPASGVVLTTSDQSFISSLADSATKKWDFKVETGTFTDGVQKSTTITLTAALA